jgi:hypothetical protein
MAQKTVQLSVRVSDDDAAFLASLDVEGAATPSEKMRAILQAERQRHGGEGTAEGFEDTLRSMMKRARQQVRSLEKDQGLRSDLVARLYERVPEIAASLMAGVGRKSLVEFEAALASDVYGLMSEFLSLALVSRNRVYADRVAVPHLAPVLELAELIRTSQVPREDQNDR